MDKLSLTQVSPSHSHSSCAKGSSRSRSHCYIYDDYAREIAPLPDAVHHDAGMQRAISRKCKRRPPLYTVVLLALIVFLVHIGASLPDVPSTRLLEDILCHKYHHDTSSALVPEDQCTMDAVQGELNVISTGSLIMGYLPGIFLIP